MASRRDGQRGQVQVPAWTRGTRRKVGSGAVTCGPYFFHTSHYRDVFLMILKRGMAGMKAARAVRLRIHI
jgi:hypothetical protein